jgi:hypothetical protein
MKTGIRSGARANQTIHIEHTVPVSELAKAICGKRKFQFSWLVWFLMKHSVTTAMAKKQERGLSLRTEALNPASDAHNRPFVRYRALNDEIWDVWGGNRITSDFTFADHLKLVISILHDLGATELAETLTAHDDIFVA